jgi:hypothetical protein
MSGALLLGVDAIVWADARDTPATDEREEPALHDSTRPLTPA